MVHLVRFAEESRTTASGGSWWFFRQTVVGGGQGRFRCAGVLFDDPAMSRGIPRRETCSWVSRTCPDRSCVESHENGVHRQEIGPSGTQTSRVSHIGTKASGKRSSGGSGSGHMHRGKKFGAPHVSGGPHISGEPHTPGSHISLGVTNLGGATYLWGSHVGGGLFG